MAGEFIESGIYPWGDFMWRWFPVGFHVEFWYCVDWSVSVVTCKEDFEVDVTFQSCHVGGYVSCCCHRGWDEFHPEP